MRVLLQLALLCVAGAAVGLGANALSPRTAPLGTPVRPQAETTPGTCAAGGAGATGGAFAPIQRITVAQAQPLCVQCTAAFVDARPEDEFTQGHVTSAFHLPPGDVPAGTLASLKGYATVVVYDGEPSGAMAEAVAMGLREMGVKDVRVLEGSWPEWAAKGGPGQSGPCPVCQAPGGKK